ncbi:MAG: cobalamin-dependent protein [Candidatus Tritonobacter lacicola]|nr:cobalamin-dependent protein [Candidatus Tritonobacter lacicola]
MKILLCQSYLGPDEPPIFPLGLSCIAAALEGHEVRTYDPNVSGSPMGGLAAAVEEFQPDVVGISLRSIDSTHTFAVSFYYGYLRPMLEAIKGACPGAVIVVGGPAFSIFAGEIMPDQPLIDYGVSLEGEVSFPGLLDNLGRPAAVKGIYYRSGGDVIFTGASDPPRSFPSPRRDLFDSSLYTSWEDAVGVETKRGCVLKCAYCTYPFLSGSAMRLKDPDDVAGEMEDISARHGVKIVIFTDSVFNLPRAHAEAICERLIDRNVRISWSAWLSARNTDREFLILARRAGCVKISFSPDAYSDHSLSLLRKGITMADISRSFSAARSVGGMRVAYNFFGDPPGSRAADFIRLLGFYARARLLLRGRLAGFNISRIRIEPHTEIRDMALGEGQIERGASLLDPVFYRNVSAPLVELLFSLFTRLKEGLKRLKGRFAGPDRGAAHG